jgi:hypothetical protein
MGVTIEGRHPMWEARLQRLAARVPKLQVGDTWTWNDADRHPVEVLGLEPGHDFPWPMVTGRFASGTVIRVGASAFAGATLLRRRLQLVTGGQP